MSEKKKVLMLLSNPFRPDPRVHREAKSLVAAGYRVTILCWDREQSSPPEETIDGIRIIRTGPKSGYGESGSFIRALPKFWKAIRLKANELQFDIVHAHDLDTLSPGLKLASKRKVPLIYDSHEIYHEMAGENLSGILLKLLTRYEKKMVRKPKIMITVNEPIADLFRGFGAKDVRIVMNCQPDVQVDAADVEKIKMTLSPDGKPVAIYIGVLEPNRLLAELATEHSNGKSDFILAIGGFGTLEGQLKLLSEKSNGRVKFIGRVKPSDVAKYNQAADILLATYDPSLKNNRFGAPNKLFEAMISSKPIIVSKDTFAGQVVEENQSGLAVKYGANYVLIAIMQILDDDNLYRICAESGRIAYETKYNWPVMEKRLLDAYSDLQNE